MTETKTVKLTTPISFNGENWSEVTLRVATLGDMIAADRVEGERSKQAAIYASVCGVSFPAFCQIVASDYMKIVDGVDALSGEVSAPAQDETGAELQG